MRIEGMDAPIAVKAVLPESRTVPQKNKVVTKEKSITPVESNSSIESINISQISNFEISEMPISEKAVIQAIQKANRAISGANRRFEFSIHEKTKEVMIKVIDSDTNDVIREIPSEKILDMIASMWEMAGLIVDERR